MMVGQIAGATWRVPLNRQLTSSPLQCGKEGPLRYITSADTASGALLRRDVTGTITVLEAPGGSAPVGTAFCTGANPAGVALWRLSVRGQDVPGVFAVLHRWFRSV
jgi:hypothetical protein